MSYPDWSHHLNPWLLSGAPLCASALRRRPLRPSLRTVTVQRRGWGGLTMAGADGYRLSDV
eukprot:5761623-Lingulodinium_polyedra.AAC.1